MQPPKRRQFPINPAPLSGLGILFTLGFVLDALAFDLLIWEEDIQQSFDSAKSFFYRKSVKPATFLKVILVLLLLGGFFNYTRNLIGVFITDISRKRKISDVLGFFLFLANVWVGIMQVRPKEIQIGLLWKEKQPWSDIQVRTFFEDLYMWHLINVVLSLLLLVQQFISFNAQKEVQTLKKEV